jgi:chromosome segregation ATPase
MNLVGKIFTIFIFAMAVIFAAVAGAFYIGHRTPTWRDVALEREKERTAAQNEKKSAKERNEAVNQQLKDEKDRLARDLAKLETENTGLDKEWKGNKKIVDDKAQELRDAVQRISAIHTQLAALRTTVTTLNEEIKTNHAARDEKLKELLRVKDELNVLVDEYLRLKGRYDELLKDLEKARGTAAMRQGPAGVR